MIVFAFDRDWTVDVNPPPDRAAVALEWVRHLAHDTGHPVYAIGNQRLAEEAAIPGVVDVVGRHDDAWDDWLGEKRPDGYYERFPTRRERLALIADLHPDADRYVVVDDIDLSDVAGWDHYHAWEFVPAVERGDVDPALPWAREPVTDGGLPSSAGIVPVDAAHLSSFLDEHGDTGGFELTYTDDGESCTELLWRVSLDASRAETPSARKALTCMPLAPGDDPFTVGLDAIDLLAVVEIPPGAFTRHAETPPERATALRRQAEATPEAVRVSSILTLLDREDSSTEQQRDALCALRSVAANRPEDCSPAVPILRSLLGNVEEASARAALETLGAIGRRDPGAIAPATEAIISQVSVDCAAGRRAATDCLAAIAGEHPDDVVPAVPDLAAVVEDCGDGAGTDGADGADGGDGTDDTDGERAAVEALERVSRDHPEALVPYADTLGTVIADSSRSDATRMSAIASLGRCVEDSPGIAFHVVEEVVGLYDAENYRLRNNAVALTYEVAALHSDVVESHVPAIADLLSVDDTYTRINASGTLARVARDFPASVAPHTPALVDALSDDDPSVRENACWALGHLGTSSARGPLEDRRREETDGNVRTRVDWALSQVDAG